MASGGLETLEHYLENQNKTFYLQHIGQIFMGVSEFVRLSLTAIPYSSDKKTIFFMHTLFNGKL